MAPRLRLYWPVRESGSDGRPLINQGFGENAAYYAKFHDNSGQPLKGHDGIDFHAPHGTRVYAAHDGLIHYEKDGHGGEGMVIRTAEMFDYNGHPAYFRSIYWHLIGDTDRTYPSPIPLDGREYPVKAGDLIGYADNTGAPYESSGDHLHFGLFPSTGRDGDTFAEFDARQTLCEPHNGENGRIDPTPYFTGIYADTLQQWISLYQRLVSTLTRWLAALNPRQP